MEFYGLVGAAAYFLACVFVGGRLALLARQTGERPELLFGVAFLTGGAIGYPMLVTSGLLQATRPDLSRPLFFVGTAITGISAVLLVAFWRRVYHAGSGVARATIYALAIAIYGSLAQMYASTSPDTSLSGSGWYLVNLFFQGVPYALNATAGVVLYRSLRLRVPLGLEEPLVANRVLLWAIGASAISGQYVYAIVRTLLASPGTRIGASGVDTVTISTLGLLCGLSMFLAFFPNSAYRRWVERRPTAS